MWIGSCVRFVTGRPEGEKEKNGSFFTRGSVFGEGRARDFNQKNCPGQDDIVVAKGYRLKDERPFQKPCPWNDVGQEKTRPSLQKKVARGSTFREGRRLGGGSESCTPKAYSLRSTEKRTHLIKRKESAATKTGSAAEKDGNLKTRFSPSKDRSAGRRKSSKGGRKRVAILVLEPDVLKPLPLGGLVGKGRGSCSVHL